MAGIFDCSRSAFRHTFGVKVLRIDRPYGRRVRKFDGPSGRGLWYRPLGNAYEVSVTGFNFWVRWHDKHYDDEPPSVAFPPLVPYGTTFFFPPAVSVGRQKESAFMGRLGALLRPTCTSYAGCAQWTIKL